MTYGAEIKRGREAMRMTQEQLAEAIGVSRQAVSKWEMDLSRPTREKLTRLSEVLEIPAETWEAIDAEQAAAERPKNAARPWQAATAALTVLCLLLSASLLWALSARTPKAPPETEPAVPLPAGREEDPFPEVLPLESYHDYDFGDWPYGAYERELLPMLDQPGELAENTLWEGVLPGPEGAAPAYLRIVRAEPMAETAVNPDGDQDVILYNMYLLYAIPDSNGDYLWQIAFRMAEENAGAGTEPVVTAFSNVLGYEGFRVDFTSAADWRDSFYITRRDGGAPALMALCSGADWAAETDVDEDGVLEIVYPEMDFGSTCHVSMIDTVSGEEGAYRYTVDIGDLSGLSFAPEKGGFVVTDEQEAVMARYILKSGRLERRPVTDFTAMDYIDVADTVLTFVTEDLGVLSDGRGPDEVIYTGARRITHRQWAYLALEELYRMTGLKVPSCYVAANEYGVCFSLLPDGFDQRSFFSAHLPEALGGVGIPSFHIAYREREGCEWSPLSVAEAVCPPVGAERGEALKWVYDQMSLFRTGKAERVVGEELTCTNGDLFLCTLQETARGWVLTDLYGPYPNGEVNH
ncbi:MAG: helix-turn-helix transcriptional regulator [Oscillospiraceae bacterium]|jgi:transcriptional regulator with XRE-family HTH domain|nr:helix-turn-helix transcriptional regulator [Oscillospiraceae bacterium]